MIYFDSFDGELRLKNQFFFEYLGFFGVWRFVIDFVVLDFIGFVFFLFVLVDLMIVYFVNMFERVVDWECNIK